MKRLKELIRGPRPCDELAASGREMARSPPRGVRGGQGGILKLAMFNCSKANQEETK
jgi:hypothetical protein